MKSVGSKIKVYN